MLMLLTLLFSARAQSAFYLGTSAGVNGSKFRFTEDMLELYPEQERLPGLNVGLETGFQVGQWSFGTGLEYLQKGAKYQTGTFETEEGQRGYFRARERLHFITVPVQVGYSAYLTDRIGYKVAAGPSFDFGITGRIDETTEFFGSDQTEFQNHKVEFGEGVNDDYNGMMTNFRLSPSLYMDLTRNHRLSLNAVWDWGVNDAFNERYRQANDFFRDHRGTLSTRMAAVTIGYQYRIPFSDRY